MIPVVGLKSNKSYFLTNPTFLIKQNVNSKTKASLQTILDFLTQRNLDSYEIILNKLAGGSALFPDNE